MRYCPLCRRPLYRSGGPTFLHFQAHVFAAELRYNGWDPQHGHRFQLFVGGKEFSDGFECETGRIRSFRLTNEQICVAQRRYLRNLLSWLPPTERNKIIERYTSPQ